MMLLYKKFSLSFLVNYIAWHPSISLVFGNSALGSSANLKVKLLSGVRVEVRGQIPEDSN
jgi:hypothetical protein